MKYKLSIVNYIFNISIFFFVSIIECATVKSKMQDPRWSEFQGIKWNEEIEVEVDYYESPVFADNKNSRDRYYKFYISSAMKDVGEEDLEFMAMSKFVKNALIRLGYKPVSKPEDADFVVRIAYGIGYSHTETSVYQGPGYSWTITGWYWSHQPGPTITQKTDIYRRSLIVTAWTSNDPSTAKQLWLVKCESTGTSNDLRLIIPYMATACFQQFGIEGKKKYNVTNQWIFLLDVAVYPAVFGINFGTDSDEKGVIKYVWEGSSAKKAGLQVGDRILKVNGKEVKDWKKLWLQMNSSEYTPAGSTIKLTIMREGWTSPKDVILTKEKIEIE